MHDVKVQIRCQRCGNQMELKDPGPDDTWTPQQFWECQACGRHFWTTYPPPKKPVPPKATKPAPPQSDVAAPQARPVANEAKSVVSSAPPHTKPSPESPPEEKAGSVAKKPEYGRGSNSAKRA